MVVKFLKYILILSVLFLVGCGDSVEKKEVSEPLKKAEKAGKDSAEQRFLLGSQYFKARKYEHAISNYLAGLKLKPDSALGYNLLGMAYRFKYRQTGNYTYREKEIKAFRKSVEINPMFIPAVKNLAVTLFEIEEKKEAVKYFRQALELNPMDPEKELIIKMINSVENR